MSEIDIQEMAMDKGNLPDRVEVPTRATYPQSYARPPPAPAAMLADHVCSEACTHEDSRAADSSPVDAMGVMKSAPAAF